MSAKPLDLDAVEALCAAATPGPWQWRVNPASRSFYLEGTPRSGNEFVMGFERWGMGSAQPTLRKWVDADCDGGGYHLLSKGVEFLKPIDGRLHHASWAQTVDQPDANFIAAARTLVPQLVARVRELEAEMSRRFAADSEIIDGLRKQLEAGPDDAACDRVIEAVLSVHPRTDKKLRDVLRAALKGE